MGGPPADPATKPGHEFPKPARHKAHSECLDNDLIFPFPGNLCGHYKGIDWRIREHLVTKEISIGDYVLTGGEIPAVVIADAMVQKDSHQLYDGG